MKVFKNVFDAEEDFGVGDTAPAPNRSLPSGGFDVEPFNFGATPSISGFGARAIPFDLKLANTVGDGEVNEPKDVGKTRRLLTVTGDLVPGGRTKTDPNGDVNLGIYGLQQRVGAKRDGYMRPRGETVTKALKTLFGAGGQNTPKPTPGARPAISAPAKTIDAFARAAKASPPPLPAVKPGGPDGIVLGGSVMAQSEGLTRRIETLAPRGYRFFPKMGSLAAHWVGPDLLPISEKRVQNLMRRFTAQGARKSPARAAPSRNVTLGSNKAVLPGEAGGVPPKPPIPSSKTAALGELRRTPGGIVLTPIGKRSWKLPNRKIGNPDDAAAIERIMRNVNAAVEKGTGGAGRILGAAGRSGLQAVEGRFGIGPETWRVLVRVGIFRSNNTDLMSGVQAFNEALFSGGAIIGDLALRTLQAVENAGIGAIVQFAREAGESETGARKLQRDLGLLAFVATIVTGGKPSGFGRGKGIGPKGTFVAKKVEKQPKQATSLRPREFRTKVDKRLVLQGEWVGYYKRNQKLPGGTKASEAGRSVPKVQEWLISIDHKNPAGSRGGRRGHFNEHGSDIGAKTINEYDQSARANIRWGVQYAVIWRDGRKRLQFITDRGDGTYLLTSTTLDKKLIFTHHLLENAQELKAAVGVTIKP